MSARAGSVLDNIYWGFSVFRIFCAVFRFLIAPYAPFVKEKELISKEYIPLVFVLLRFDFHVKWACVAAVQSPVSFSRGRLITQASFTAIKS